LKNTKLIKIIKDKERRRKLGPKKEEIEGNEIINLHKESLVWFGLVLFCFVLFGLVWFCFVWLVGDNLLLREFGLYGLS
jgi:hypothetical protein